MKCEELLCGEMPPRLLQLLQEMLALGWVQEIEI